MKRQPGSRRLFVALRIEARLAEQFVAAQDDLKRDGFVLAWEPETNLHLTLHFLGPVEDARLPALETALDEVAGGRASFSLGFCGLGHFTRDGRTEPTVVWAGCECLNEDLPGLAGEVSRAMERIGFPSSRLPFSAHVTLGRPKDPGQSERLRQRIDEERGRPFGSQVILGFVLYESSREDRRTVYRPLREFHFPP